MKSYLVGGAVRDKLLDLPVKDKDWVVVGAEPKDLTELGYTQVGKDFPVFLHPDSKEEYALARLERKTAPGHTGFDVVFSKDVTLEQDLQRRDITINAIAESESGDIIDPCNGQADLKNRLIRHVSDAFIEDPLRVLRVARFAARFGHLGFTVAEETIELMKTISASGEIQLLPPERIWREIELALSTSSPQCFVSVLKECNALEIILPEVNALFGVPQPEKYHPEIDTGLHILLCLEQTVRLSEDPVIRYAVLVHDVGKAVTDKSKWPSHVMHENLGLDLQKTIAARLKVPNEYQQLGLIVCEHHTKMHRALELRPSTLVELFERVDAFRRPERFEKFLLACEADARGRTGLEDRPYPQSNYLKVILQAANELDAKQCLADNASKAPQDAIRQARVDLVTRAVKLEREKIESQDND